MSDDTTIEGRAIPAEDAAKAQGPAPLPPRQRNRRGLVVGAIALPLALGAVGLSLARGDVSPLTPVAPTSIAAFQPSGAIAAKGEVAEIYGNKFIVQDATGRALVETGREGEGGGLVKKGETVTVQGRFEDGFLHATRLTYADGRVLPLGPGGPPRGPLGWAKDRIGLGPAPDIAGITAIVQGQGYTDVRIAGRGPAHLEVAAKDRDGREQLLHVGFDGVIREARAL